MNPKPCCLPLPIRTLDLECEEGIRDQPNCFAKGMGLLMAAKGKAASFNIYLQTYELMDIVIEIKGRDNDDYCTERITLRSPRKKEVINNLFSASSFTSLENGRIINIPLEYVILSRKIAVTYTPPSSGLYELSIISKGQHIFGSPFEVRIDSVSSNSCNPEPLLDSSFPNQDSDKLDVTTENKLPSTLLKKLDTSPYGLVKKRRLVKTTVLRGYAMIELKPGEPLPQDPRAWSALTNESAILLNCRDEIQGESLDNSIFTPEILQNASDDMELPNEEFTLDVRKNTFDSLEMSNRPTAEHREQTDNTKSDYQNAPGTIIKLNEREIHRIESIANKLVPPNQPEEFIVCSEENVSSKIKDLKNSLDDTEIGSNDTKQHTEPVKVGLLQAIEERRNGRLSRSNEFKTSKSIFEKLTPIAKHSNACSHIFRQDPEGYEGNYLEVETFRSDGQRTPETTTAPHAKLRSSTFNAPNSKAGQSAPRCSALRVPERLIDEWTDLWTPNGESIVKVRVKEWENFPKT